MPGICDSSRQPRPFQDVRKLFHLLQSIGILPSCYKTDVLVKNQLLEIPDQGRNARRISVESHANPTLSSIIVVSCKFHQIPDKKRHQLSGQMSIPGWNSNTCITHPQASTGPVWLKEANRKQPQVLMATLRNLSNLLKIPEQIPSGIPEDFNFTQSC